MAPKTILGGKITDLCDTFHGRLLAYLTSKADYAKTMHHLDISAIIRKPDTFQVNNLRKLKVSEISDLLHSLNNLALTTHRAKIINILTLIEVECCLRLNSLRISQILELLNGFVSLLPNKILENRFYQNAMENLPSHIPKATPEELIELMFYISFAKMTPKSQVLMRQCLKKVNDRILSSLSLTDLCIVCDAAFKTGLRIDNPRVLKKLKEILYNNLAIMSDSPLLVTILKTFRLNHYQDDELLDTITSVIFFNSTYKYYSFITICHILALYADYKYYDEKLLEFFAKSGVAFIANDLQNPPKIKEIRIKDLHRFLWVYSTIGYTKFTKTEFEHIIYPSIMKRVTEGDCDENPDLLINLSLYLWMLGFRATDLIKLATTERNLNKLKGFGKSAVARANLLLSVICIEDEKFYRELNLKSIFSINEYTDSEEIERRPMLRQVYQIIQKVGPAYGLDTFKAHAQVINLNLVGITAIDSRKKKAVQIEVMDEECCVRNASFLPTGLMLLKLRILNYQKDPLIVVTPEDSDFMDASDLEELLHDELKLYFDRNEQQELN